MYTYKVTRWTVDGTSVEVQPRATAIEVIEILSHALARDTAFEYAVTPNSVEWQ